ncbi:MAG: PAS domain S-box protein [Alphaproteobacteria bacterium]|nr:PAS domain S-box protein [Alphaproteobacteria bacterium]
MSRAQTIPRDRPADSRRLRILLVEGETAEAVRLDTLLAVGRPCEAVLARRLADAIELVGRQQFDVVMADSRLPDGEGVEVIESLIRAAPRLPLVLLTHSHDEAEELDPVRRGAQDYLVLGQYDGQLLARTLRHAFERKRLTEENRLLAAFPQENPYPILGTDDDGDVVYANAAARDLARTCDPPAIESILPPEHAALVAGCLADGRIRSDVMSETGGRMISWTYHPSPAAGGVRLYAVDSTERATAERGLRRERDFVSAILDTTGALIVVLDPEGRIVHFNPACVAASGWAFAELRGKVIWDVLVPFDQRDQVRERLSGLGGKAKRVKHENDWVGRDGERIPISWSSTVLANPDGSTRFIVSSGLDIGDRQRAEAELRASEQRYRLLAEHANDLITRQTPDGTWLYVSPSCRELLGYGADELVGQAVSQFIHPDDCERACSATAASAVAFRMRRRDGAWAWFEASRRPVERGGVVTEVVSVARDISERRRAERSLDAVRASLANAQRLANLGNWDWNPGTDVMWWSDEVYRIFGLEPLGFAATYDAFRGFVHAADRDMVESMLRRAMGALTPYSVEYRVLRPDGRQRFVHERGEVGVEEDGQVRVSGTVLDITGRKEAEIALKSAHDDLEQRVEERTRRLQQEIQQRKRAEEVTRESEQRIRLIADATPGLIAYVDREQRYQFVNRRYVEWFGLPYDRILGRTMAEVLGAEFHRDVAPRVIKVLAGKEVSYEGWIDLPDGSRRYYHATHVPHIATNDAVLGYFSLIQDITERKRGEEALRRSEEKYRALMDDAADAIVLADEAGRVLEVNRKAEEMFGAVEARLHAQPFDRLCAPTHVARLRAAFAAIPETGSAHIGDMAVLDGRGGSLPVDLDCTVVMVGDRRIVQGIFKDISDHKRAEEQLRASKEAAELADRAKSEFLANMSHELRTPLNAIIGFSDIMVHELMGPVGSPVYHDYMKDIHDSGRHLLDVINEILDMSKVESGNVELHPEPVDLALVAQSSLRLISERAESAEVTLTADLPEDLPMVNVDQRRFKQILLNLLSNAVKFTPAGGNVGITGRLLDDGWLAVEVTDTGIGMSPEGLEKALTPFGQVDSALSRRYDGTGLGLPLTKAFVELHDGELTIDSAPGAGTTVRVRLPPSRVVASLSKEAMP